MKMISCVILDDESMAIQFLAKYIAKVPFLRLRNTFIDPTEAIRYVETNDVDLVFLDVEMPSFALDGMDFVRIAGNKCRYIFTTAYPEYALPSYEYDAIDFLHKLFSFDRFVKAVHKARLCLDDTEAVSDGMDETIYVKSENKLQRIRYDEICWIESERNYISIYTETDRINVLLAIGDIEQQLPEKWFVRVHKSFIVAYRKVEAVEKDQLFIQRDGTQKWIPMGDQFKKKFLQTIDTKTLKKQT